jgi:hypothetical protein
MKDLPAPTRPELTPMLELKTAHDALRMLAEECPYPEAVVDQVVIDPQAYLANRMRAEPFTCEADVAALILADTRDGSFCIGDELERRLRVAAEDPEHPAAALANDALGGPRGFGLEVPKSMVRRLRALVYAAYHG